MNRKVFVRVIAISVYLACRIASAQNAPAPAQSGSPMQLKAIVDGSLTPEQIPDNLAYQHFLTAIAAHAFPSEQEQARQAAQLAPLSLTPADRQTLIAGLTSFRDRLDAIDAARSSVTPGPAATTQLADLNAQASALAAAVRLGLLQSLSTDGLGQLDHYVRTRVKARIRIYGGSH